MSSEKIEAFWENATAKDVERVMAGEAVEARFRDSEVRDWQIGRLNGWADREFRCELANCWRYCQVYREPSWYTDKPDPGPGFRLLEKFPDEPKLGTDEAWQSIEHRWDLVRNDDGIQAGRTWYRRRVEAVEPEPKHYVLRVGDSVETPSGHRVQVISRSETQRFWSLNAGDNLTLPNGQTITITEKGFEVTQ
jgi:hypothetical protein